MSNVGFFFKLFAKPVEPVSVARAQELLGNGAVLVDVRTPQEYSGGHATQAGGDCGDVVTQLSAVSGALDKAGFALISSAMRECFTDPAQASAGTSEKRTLSLDEVRKLFLRLA